MAGVALLPWTALIDHVGGTSSGRRENVEATPIGGPADGPIGVPPAWGIPTALESVLAEGAVGGRLLG